MKRKKNDTILPPVRPSLALEIEFRKKLDRIIREMAGSVEYWLAAKYRQNEPKVVSIAEDDNPAAALRKAIRLLSKRWQKNFDEIAVELAKYFAKGAAARSDSQLRSILRKGGITVRFVMTPAMRDILGATVNANVALIKSIPGEYFTQIEGIVMRSVQAGRDLGGLTKDLERQFGVTRRRAAIIARTQNNLATASLDRCRRLELGITEAVWMHSAGGKQPRKRHVAFSGKKFDIRVGAPIGDKGQNVMPGEEINCRCVSRPVLPSLHG